MQFNDWQMQSLVLQQQTEKKKRAVAPVVKLNPTLLRIEKRGVSD